MSGRSQEEPVACTPVVSGALAQLLPSHTTCSLLVWSYPSLSTSLHNPPRTGGDGLPAGVAGAVTACAGSAKVTVDGTSPTRVATTGTRSTAPCAPHSLLTTVSVSTPRRVPSACGASE